MNPFHYQRASSSDAAIELRSQQDNSRFLAGGTTLLDLMKCGVEQPETLIDISQLSGLDTLRFEDDKITIGALASMSQLADHPQCQALAPAIYGSLWQAASPQLRNMATIGGNLRQRTRCVYFRDPVTFPACNKRQPGSGCAALDGVNANHAIFGTSDSCIAVYPGDLAIALTAFDAQVVLRNSQQQERRVAIGDFFLLPGDRPDQEHDIAADEMIIAVEVPNVPALRQSHYLKVRDRASYEFAAASAAVGLEIEDGVIRDVRIALGGLATKPWRATAVEQALRGKPFSEEALRLAAEQSITDAAHRPQSQFKVTLTPRVIVRALLAAAEPAQRGE